MSAPTFDVRFDGSVRLTVSDVWPDGDAPEEPTATDVALAMEASGARLSVLNDWCLDAALEVYVGGSRGGPEIEVWAPRHAPEGTEG